MRKLRVLDLYAGLHGWGSAFAARGHEVISLDIDPKFNCTITADILEIDPAVLELYGPFDIILASPPCEAFSVAALSRNWEVVGKMTTTPVVVPKSEKAKLGQKLVEHTLYIIDYLQPTAWIMENPTAMMRRLEILQDIERRTVTYCQYGKTYRKPTDLWGNFPDGLELHDACTTAKNKAFPLAGQHVTMPNGQTFVTDRDGSTCHEAAPRGSKTGVQGLGTSEERAVVPTDLSLAICIAVEQQVAKALGGTP
jgi:hypothetical protein